MAGRETRPPTERPHATGRDALSDSTDRVEFFISRAGADKAIAQAVATMLEAAGYRVIVQDWDFGHANFVAKMDDALASDVRTSRIDALPDQRMALGVGVLRSVRRRRSGVQT